MQTHVWAVSSGLAHLHPQSRVTHFPLFMCLAQPHYADSWGPWVLRFTAMRAPLPECLLAHSWVTCYDVVWTLLASESTSFSPQCVACMWGHPVSPVTHLRTTSRAHGNNPRVARGIRGPPPPRIRGVDPIKPIPVASQFSQPNWPRESSSSLR
jgi:hypothetical protein